MIAGECVEYRMKVLQPAEINGDGMKCKCETFY